MVSSGMPPIHGRVVSLRDLSGVQGVSYTSPVVLRVEALGGTEDIPLGVTALLSASPVDALSHVAIRARCQGVLLAACDDAAVWTVLTGLEVRPGWRRSTWGGGWGGFVKGP
jgi:alpha-glucan,water dikinase